jgi:hypothetical protein
MIEIKDLKIGNVIYFKSKGTFGSNWILQYKGIKNKHLLQKNCISKKSFYKECPSNEYIWGNLDSIENLRLATKHERQWLDLCIKHNRFMPQPEFKQNIYELW